MQAFTAFLTLALFGWAICCLAILVFRTVDAIKTSEWPPLVLPDLITCGLQAGISFTCGSWVSDINMGSGLAVALNLWLIASLVIEVGHASVTISRCVLAHSCFLVNCSAVCWLSHGSWKPTLVYPVWVLDSFWMSAPTAFVGLLGIANIKCHNQQP